MRLRDGLWIALVGCALLSQGAAGGSIVTDANIVTALDISDSIDARAMSIEIDGMAEAICAPAILQAIARGPHHRIGFAIFAWRDGAYPELVSWSIIASKEDAVAVASRLEAGFRAFLRSDDPQPFAHMTDLSGAIDHAAVLLLTAPFTSERLVLNVIGDGWDNVGEAPQHARDRLVAKGGTINGVVLGIDPVLMSYYRSYVIGGPGAFVLPADSAASVPDIFARKFLYDVAGGPASDGVLLARAAGQ